MNSQPPFKVQEYVLWPLVAICVVLGAMSGGTERALYFLAAVFLFAFSRQQPNELLNIISETQKRLAALSRDLIESTGALDRRVVQTESELKRLAADIELLRTPLPKPAFTRGFLAGVMMLIIGCCMVFLLLRSETKTLAYRLERFESGLQGTETRLSSITQRGDEMLNRVNLTEGRLDELSADVKDRMVSALAQCLRPSLPARSSPVSIREPASPKVESKPETLTVIREPGLTSVPEKNSLQLISEAQPAPAPSARGVEPVIAQSEAPRASAAFRSFRQEH